MSEKTSKEYFVAQVIQYQDSLYRMAKALVKDEDFAKDILQDLYVKLWVKREHLVGVIHFHAYMMRALRNLCLDNLKKNRWIMEDVDDHLESGTENPHALLERKDFNMMISKLIEQLPELQRTVLHLKDVEGLDVKEIAYISDLTENAVRVNLCRARQRLREMIQGSKNK
ncbi:sigma-70 family RNA polymerase sigma factor [Bacteroidales bacterium OttesenSCG-928-B11]|nr:sigma-70 family RNA polymerase sigma factor [Bacteroidales bacterium OttesenSCG-928-B11]MDL2326364.1 sigma-70 family RNA polymerase sigma factor [Bacteroidales bacterium OttesenSCG-928-A14]